MLFGRVIFNSNVFFIYFYKNVHYFLRSKTYSKCVIDNAYDLNDRNLILNSFIMQIFLLFCVLRVVCKLCFILSLFVHRLLFIIYHIL